jgi:asparagine synthase (glutamine-hydrolysing)
MCGIVGLVNTTVEDVRGTLHVMCEALYHRGPDGEGIDQRAASGIGMRRLSIIDLSSGDQPIYNEDGRLAIVFNGEIYNYLELRDELIAQGHHFQTHSDTETIVHAYEEWGAACLARLNGMFAFAIWDRTTDQMFMARDRIGKKPLYYRQDGTSFAFASELRALRQIPGLTWTLNTEAIHHYLSLQYIPAPLSIFREVHKLPPAHYLITDGHTVTIQRYWDLDFEPKWDASWADLRRLLRELVSDAVRLRLRSDVPLGVFLSGGLDSAIVLAEMARLMDRPVEAFTISFDESAFDEADYAAQAAELHGAHHHRFMVHLSAADDPFMLASWLDEPFANSSALPTFYLSQQTRQHVTVALSGDGGDEVFGGYQRYVLDRLIRPYEALPAWVRDPLIEAATARIHPRQDVPTEANWRLGLKRLRQVTSIPRTASLLRWGSYFSEPMKAALYTAEMRATCAGLDSTAILDVDYRRARAIHPLDRTLYTDLVNYLTDDGHVKIDRMAMANSLEVRNPYVDVRVVEFAARLPLEAKIAGFTQKRLLREAFRDVLPPATVKRPKRGFAVPLGTWFNRELGTIARETLLAPNSCTRPLFEPHAVQRLFDEHWNGRDDHGKRLWALLMLELWLQKRM